MMDEETTLPRTAAIKEILAGDFVKAMTRLLEDPNTPDFLRESYIEALEQYIGIS